MGADAVSENRFEVLFVCTANQCRSPIAEFLLRAELDALNLDGPWLVSSAGIAARDGDPIHPLVDQLLASRGLSTKGWQSKRLTPSIVAPADLILTATAVHRRAVVVAEPRSIRRTHVLRQFADLCDVELPPGAQGSAAGHALLTAALAARPLVPVPRAGEKDLSDPIGRPYDAFERCAATISESFRRILRPVSEQVWGHLQSPPSATPRDGQHHRPDQPA